MLQWVSQRRRWPTNEHSLGRTINYPSVTYKFTVLVDYRTVSNHVTLLSHPQQPRDVHAMLVQCLASVADGGPTFSRGWVSVSCCRLALLRKLPALFCSTVGNSWANIRSISDIGATFPWPWVFGVWVYTHLLVLCFFSAVINILLEATCCHAIHHKIVDGLF